MVFFTCNACGQSVKKAQVEKHYMTQCRNCEVLSCMDCGKDFAGDAYKEHTSCVTENEKYGGKNYKAPAKGNKGEVKQQQWLQRVREAKESTTLSPEVAKLLDRIAEFPNIPRKKAKFENFMYNCLRVSNRGLVEKVWTMFLEAGVNIYKDLMNEASNSNNNNDTVIKAKMDSGNTDSTSESNDKSQSAKANQSDATECVQSERTELSKDTKKEKKKDKKTKGKKSVFIVEEKHSVKEKRKNHQGNPDVDVSAGKRKLEAEEEEDDENQRSQKMFRLEDSTPVNGEERSKGAKKKRKKDKKMKDKNSLILVTDIVEEKHSVKDKRKKHKGNPVSDFSSKKRKQIVDEEEGNDDETSPKMSQLEDFTPVNGEELTNTKKFKWVKVITSVLQDCDDHQLSLKKLRKKVLNEFHCIGGDVRIKTAEQLRATFEKKVNKNPNFKVHKEMVTLVS